MRVGAVVVIIEVCVVCVVPRSTSSLSVSVSVSLSHSLSLMSLYICPRCRHRGIRARHGSGGGEYQGGG